MPETFYALRVATPRNGLMAISGWLPTARVACGHPITPLETPRRTPMESGQKHPQTDYRRMGRGSHGQGHCQTVTGVTVVTGPRAQGGPEGGPGGVPRGLQGAPGRVPEKKWPRKRL
jgi:hypothetical protein